MMIKLMHDYHNTKKNKMQAESGCASINSCYGVMKDFNSKARDGQCE